MNSGAAIEIFLPFFRHTWAESIYWNNGFIFEKCYLSTYAMFANRMQ